MPEEEQLFDPGPLPPLPELPPPNPSFRARIEVTTSLIFDLKHFFREHVEEYLEFELEDGYDWTDKPMVFLHQWIEQETEPQFYPIGDFVRGGWDDIDIDFDRFGETEAADLHLSLGLNREGTERVH